MSYLQRSSRSKKKLNKVYGIVFIAALLIVVYVFAPSFSSGVVHGIARPFLKAKTVVVDQGSFVGDFFNSKSSLINQNDELKARLREEEAKMVSFDKIMRENIELRQLFNRRVSTSTQVNAGRILSYPPHSPYGTMIIDIGERDGVTRGDIVSRFDIALGRVSYAGNSTSQVRLFSHPREETKARLSRRGIPLTLEGRGGGGFEAQAPKDIEIQAGDTITLADDNGPIIARVEEVSQESTDSFQTLYATMPVNIFEIEWLVIKRQATSVSFDQ